MAKFKCTYRGCGREFPLERAMKTHITLTHKTKKRSKKRPKATKKKKGGVGGSYASMPTKQLVQIYHDAWTELKKREKELQQVEL